MMLGMAGTHKSHRALAAPTGSMSADTVGTTHDVPGYCRELHCRFLIGWPSLFLSGRRHRPVSSGSPANDTLSSGGIVTNRRERESNTIATV